MGPGSRSTDRESRQRPLHSPFQYPIPFVGRNMVLGTPAASAAANVAGS